MCRINIHTKHTKNIVELTCISAYLGTSCFQLWWKKIAMTFLSPHKSLISLLMKFLAPLSPMKWLYKVILAFSSITCNKYKWLFPPFFFFFFYKSLIWCYPLSGINNFPFWTEEDPTDHFYNISHQTFHHWTPGSLSTHVQLFFLQLNFPFSPRELLLLSLQCLTGSLYIMLSYIYSAYAFSSLCDIIPSFPTLKTFCSPFRTWLRYHPLISAQPPGPWTFSLKAICTELLY